MPVYEYEGKHFDLPDGLSNEQAIAKIEAHLGKTAAPAAEAPMNPLVEGAGKTARTLVNGVAAVPGYAADFVSGGANLILEGIENLGNAAPGRAGRAPYFSQTKNNVLDAAGLPKPEGAFERGAYGALEAVTGGGVLGAATKTPALMMDSVAKVGSTALGAAVAEPVAAGTKELTGSDVAATAASLLASFAAGSIGGAAGRKLDGKLSGAPGPVTMADVERRAKAAYATVDASGVALKPAAVQGMITRIEGELLRNNYRPAINPEVSAMLHQMRRDVGSQRVSFAQLEQLRGLAGQLRGVNDPNIKRLGGILIREFDDAVANLNQQDLMRLQGSTAANLKDAVTAVQSARKDWATLAKATKLDDLLNIAEVRTAMPGASESELIRGAFINLAKDKKKMAQFSSDEKKAILEVTKGIPFDRTLGFLGRFSPARNQFSGGIQGAGVGAALATGNPVPAMLSAGSAALTMGADKAQSILRRKQAEDAIQQILSGRSKVSKDDLDGLRGLFGGALGSGQ